MKHVKKPPVGLDGIRDISNSGKLVKELAGIPTYIAIALLALTYVGHNILVSLAVFVSFLMIYHFLYAFLFPDFDTAGQKQKLAVLVIGQILFWMIVFFVLRLFMA